MLMLRRIQEVDKMGRLFALPPAVSDKTETSRGDAFEPCRSYSTHSEEWKTMHPDRGARFLATWSRGVAPMTRGPGIASNRDPARVSHRLPDSLISATPWRGRISFPSSSFPESSGLRPSTSGLKTGDPSGASPLRDRQAGALGEESRAADLLCIAVKIKCVTAGVPGIGDTALRQPCRVVIVCNDLSTGLPPSDYDAGKKIPARGASLRF